MKTYIKILQSTLLSIMLFASSINLAMEPLYGNRDSNTLTDMVQALTKCVGEIRDKSAKINNPDQDIQARDQIVNEIKELIGQLASIDYFVNNANKNDQDFKNKLNNEGMPARIIEGGLELSFRYDLDALSRSLNLGTSEENEDISLLDYMEYNIYNALENLHGPLLTFHNLAKRYNSYKRFLFEEREGKYGEKDANNNYIYKFGKRYTPQEAHVVLHIAAYVLAIEEALALAKYDEGRHLYNLLKVYVEWLQTFSTHTHYDVDILKAHGSLLGIADKNNKTMLNWTNEFIAQLNKYSFSHVYANGIKKEFAEIKRSLQQGLYENPETGVIEKGKTRDVLGSDTKKLNEWGFKPVKPIESKRIKSLDLATKK